MVVSGSGRLLGFLFLLGKVLLHFAVFLTGDEHAAHNHHAAAAAEHQTKVGTSKKSGAKNTDRNAKRNAARKSKKQARQNKKKGRK